MALTREQILGIQDVKIELLNIPEWNDDIYVKSMTGEERDRFESSIVKNKGKSQSVNVENIRAKLCAYTICDENGKLLFTEQDIRELGKKNANALTRVFMVARNLSGIGEEEMETLAEEVKVPFEDSVSD